MHAILPKVAYVLPVGGISPDAMSGYWAAGANGFGLGSALYAVGKKPADIKLTAEAFVRAFGKLKS